MLEPRDQILADKRFTIQDLLTPIGCELAIPAFLSSKGQFTKKDLALSKQIHNLRVHVERAIRRVKEFHFFDSHSTFNGWEYQSIVDSGMSHH